jgi:hypothetical protein
MKALPFQEQGVLPLTINVRILKLWNSTVCSVHSSPVSHYDTVSRGAPLRLPAPPSVGTGAGRQGLPKRWPHLCA